MLLLITGSKSNVNPRLAPRQAVEAKRAGITIMGIGVGLKDDSEIRNIVRDDRKIVLVRDHLALMEVALDVASLVCQGEILANTRARLIVLSAIFSERAREGERGRKREREGERQKERVGREREGERQKERVGRERERERDR